jgi:hypothetical protein
LVRDRHEGRQTHYSRFDDLEDLLKRMDQ